MAKFCWSSEENTEELERALHDGYNPNYDIDGYGATALHRFAKMGWSKSVRILLNHSITNTDVLDEEKCTPLHYAASAPEEMFDQSLEVTNLLLDHGLDIDAVCYFDTDFGNYTSACASMSPTALFIAIQGHNVSLTALLLERGANPDIRNRVGFTPLMFLMDMCTSYEDSVLEELVSMLLFYNIDVNWSFNTYPLITAVLWGKEVICNLLVGHFIEYHLQVYVKQDFCNYSTVVNCVNNKFHVDTIINIADRIHFKTSGLIKSLLISGELENSKLFNHLYHKLKLRDIQIEDCKSADLASFFAYSKFNKTDFMSAVEKLFDVELDIGWDLSNMSRSYYELFIRAKPRLNLQLEDMERILYQMFLFCHEINIGDLKCIFRACLIHDGSGLATGFTDDFEIFLKSGIITHIRDFDLMWITGSDIFGELLYPYSPQLSGPSEVKSLLFLTREVIRRNLQPRVSSVLGNIPKPVDFFQYYRRVRRLDIPQVLNDIILMKRHVNLR